MLKSLSSSCSFIDLQILFAFLPPQVKGVWELNGMKAPIKAAGGTSLRGLGCPLRAGVRAWGPGRSFDTAPPPPSRDAGYNHPVLSQSKVAQAQEVSRTQRVPEEATSLLRGAGRWDGGLSQRKQGGGSRVGEAEVPKTRSKTLLSLSLPYRSVFF